jgi:hypothetical protein
MAKDFKYQLHSCILALNSAAADEDMESDTQVSYLYFAALNTKNNIFITEDIYKIL